MVLFTSAIGRRLLSRQNGIGLLMRSTSKFNGESEKLIQVRSLSSITGTGIPSVSNSLIDFDKYPRSSYANLCNKDIQKRGFLGCGDGSNGNPLSKTHEERRVLGYTPEQVFAVVAGVDLYEDFVPWCQRSKVIRRNADGSFDAELEIGFKFLVESYVSHVELNKPKSVKSTVSQSNLFDHLVNIWEFSPGPVPGTCDIYFMVDFKFQSPLYRQVASVFFTEVVTRLVSSFSERCRTIYGPGVQVLEKSYER